jgi:hypothetical protein
MRGRLILSVLVCLVLLSGVSLAADKVENPLYNSWAKFKPGSSSTMNMAMSAEGRSMNMEIKKSLVEVKPDKAVVKIVTTMSMPGMQIPPREHMQEIPKMIDPKAKDSKQIDPAAVAQATEETVKVPAGTFKAKAVTIVNDEGGQQSTGKGWFTEEVPGGLVKLEVNSQRGDMKGELTAMEKK